MHHEADPAAGPCVCTALRKATRAVSRVYDEALEAAGLTTTQFAILRHVARAGTLPLSRLAEQLVMERTSLYRTLEPMQRHGWIAIAPAPAGRAKVVSLTAGGTATMDGAAAHWERVQARLVETLGAERWRALETLLAEAVAGAEALQ